MKYLLLTMIAVFLTSCGVEVREPPTATQLQGDLTAAQAANLRLQTSVTTSTAELQKLTQAKADSDVVFDQKIKQEQANNAKLVTAHRQAEAFWAAGILSGLALIATVLIFVISAEALLFTRLAIGAGAAAATAFGFGEIIPYLSWIAAGLALAGITVCILAWRKHHSAMLTMGSLLASGTLTNLHATATTLLSRGSTIFSRIEALIKAKL